MLSQQATAAAKQTAARFKAEAMEYGKQVESLLDELREKSDSESFDDEKKRLLNVKKGMQLDKLREENKNLDLELKQAKQDGDANVLRLQSNLKAQRIGNQNLKNDYDSLQEKFDKNMKASYNMNAELKQEIDQLMDRNSKLQISIEDAAEELMDLKRQKDKQREKELGEKDEIIDKLTEEKSTVQKELGSFK